MATWRAHRVRTAASCAALSVMILFTVFAGVGRPSAPAYVIARDTDSRCSILDAWASGWFDDPSRSTIGSLSATTGRRPRVTAAQKTACATKTDAIREERIVDVRNGTARLIFLHIHKAGGTTLCSLAAANGHVSNNVLPGGTPVVDFDSNCVPSEAFLPDAGASV